MITDTLERTTAAPAKTGRRKLSIIIPAFNEEGGVRQGVALIARVIAESGIDAEIVIVNDGSTDNTLAEAQATGMRIVSYADNVGYGYAIKTGVAATDSEYVAITDADATYPPEALPKMLEMCMGADMIVGDRGAAMSNVPMIRRPAKWVLNNLANYLAGRKINDLNSGLRVFKRSSLEQFIYLLPDGFSLTTTITLCMLSANMKIIYEPIVYGKRVGHSKMRASQFFNFLLLVVRITVFFQPLRVFLPLGAALFVMGVAKAIYDVNQDNLSETAVLGLLGAVMVWSLGLLADMIARLAQRR